MKPIKQKIFSINILLLILLMMTNCSGSKKLMGIPKQVSDTLLEKLLNLHPEFFDAVIKKKNEFNVQIIYTEINRKKNGGVVFTDHYFNVNKEKYFYPASTVKFPVAILALQKLNELKKKGLDKNTTMITGADGEIQTNVYNDPTTEDGRPTIAHYIKKILLVSDNDAFNRLYEFLGQEYINKTLHNMRYDDVQIIHRLEISLTEEQNRHTNPIKFIDTNGNIIYEQTATNSKLKYARRNTRLGKGYMKGNELVNGPFDFSKKNRLSLQDLHNILQTVIFPAEKIKEKRFNLTKEDYTFLYKYMSMYPRESAYPYYDSTEYNDTYVKFLLYGSEPVMTEPHIRIFNKVGDAYGFLIDAAYIVDYKNNVEFMLTATIHCNSDGIFNDNKYDYDTIGFPFFKNLGRVIYEHELKRERTIVPDLSSFRVDYRSEK